MMKTYQIDRFEGNYAVFIDINDFSVLTVLKSDLPLGAKELDVIQAENNHFTIDYDLTEKLKKEAEELFEELTKEG